MAKVIYFSSQLQTLECLRLFYRLRGYSPTYRELADLRGLSDKAVHRHIRQLAARGYVRKTKAGAWRQIQLVDKEAA